MVVEFVVYRKYAVAATEMKVGALEEMGNPFSNVDPVNLIGNVFVEGGSMTRYFADVGIAMLTASPTAVVAVVCVSVPTPDELVIRRLKVWEPDSGSPVTTPLMETATVDPMHQYVIQRRMNVVPPVV